MDKSDERTNREMLSAVRNKNDQLFFRINSPYQFKIIWSLSINPVELAEAEVVRAAR